MMTTIEIEQAILDIFKRIYCKEYISKLKVTVLSSEGYNLMLAMNNKDKPININYEGTVENFLKFVEEELRQRHFNTDTYSRGYKVRNG